ncbi:hypothetical protein GCT13_36300 [Paraburkholderia sp. CNPSo 3157]|uniref:Uncharacterized protein n=1 Tax=Paraburkholderia franconis TaxID=2654983 RepID=A0A7X1TJX4_9BURK|nr:hypothetical protein [Paraburkholderia franconis]MPW22152.1 hypothetical protein [Paraburkholderia franconis]
MPSQPIPVAEVESDASVPRWKTIERDDSFTHLVGSDALGTGGVVSYRSGQACASPLIILGLSNAIY